MKAMALSEVDVIAVLLRLTLTDFRIIEELANSNESDCFAVKLSMKKWVACATETVRKGLAAPFGEMKGGCYYPS
jgi:hypothetical protein